MGSYPTSWLVDRVWKMSSSENETLPPFSYPGSRSFRNEMDASGAVGPPSSDTDFWIRETRCTKLSPVVDNAARLLWWTKMQSDWLITVGRARFTAFCRPMGARTSWERPATTTTKKRSRFSISSSTSSCVVVAWWKKRAHEMIALVMDRFVYSFIKPWILYR